MLTTMLIYFIINIQKHYIVNNKNYKIPYNIVPISYNSVSYLKFARLVKLCVCKYNIVY